MWPDAVDVRNELRGDVLGLVVQAGTIERVTLPESHLVPVPRQLPPPARDFVGRDTYWTQLDTVMELGEQTATTATAVLDGTAGIGKTALAVQWAHRVQQRFPDGTLFADLRGYGPSEPLSPSRVLTSFLLAFGVPEERIPAERDAQVGLYRSLLTERRVLVVLDNASSAEQVRPLLPGSAGCVTVVTSRASLTGLAVADAARHVTLDTLPVPEAAELVRGVIGTDRAAAEPDAVADLIRICAGLPLALRVATTRIATRRHAMVADVVDDIAEEQTTLDAFSTIDDDRAAVRTVFDWSYNALPASVSHLFRCLGLHPVPQFGVHAAAAIADLDLTATARDLNTLADLHLIEPTPRRKHYQIHDLLHDYALQRFTTDETETVRHEAMTRLVIWYASIARHADRLLYPTSADIGIDLGPVQVPAEVSDRHQAADWLAVEYLTLIRIQHLAERHGVHAAVILLASALRCLTWQPRTVWQLRLDAEARGLVAARASRDRESEAFLLVRRSDTYRQMQRWRHASADLWHVLMITDNPVRAREAWGGLGLVHLSQQRYEQARVCYQKVLSLARATGSASSEAVVECNLSRICRELGDYDEALRHAQRQLVLRRDVGDEAGEAQALYDVAMAWHGLGEYEQAVEFGEQAVSLFRIASVSKQYLARALETLAYSLDQGGHRERALTVLREANGIFADLDDPHAESLAPRLRELEADGELSEREED